MAGLSNPAWDQGITEAHTALHHDAWLPLAGSLLGLTQRGAPARNERGMNKTAGQGKATKAWTQRELFQSRASVHRAQKVLTELHMKVLRAQECLSLRSQHLMEANEHLVASALNAHSAAELAERCQRNAATSCERKAQTELRAKDALAVMNVNLELRVTQRTCELEAARDGALAAVRAKEEFLSNMSHEIRTPMNGMLGALELLSLTALQPNQTQYLNVAATSGEALLAILNEVLDFAKIGSNLFCIERKALLVNEVARSVVALFSALAERKGIDLQFMPDDRMSQMRLGDALHLRQVLLNLVGNAMKFTPYGMVVLQTRLVQDGAAERIAFEVRDAGIGIDASQLQRIFEPFVQAEDTRQEHPGGTGLGLSISQRLVRAMGGELTVESTRGKGSTFRFELELDRAPEAPVVPAAEAELPISSTDLHGQVLLVEDNMVNQMVGVAMLESMGLEVVVANNGQEALAQLVDPSSTIVLMDCQMPVMDGYEATRRLREDELRRGLPRRTVIALTASAFEDDITRCLAAGMDAHLSKPYSSRQLRAAIAPWLQERKPLRLH